MSPDLVRRHRPETRSHLGERLLRCPAVADQPAADDRASASDATPAVHVDDLALREEEVDRIEDVAHRRHVADVHVLDRVLRVVHAHATFCGEAANDSDVRSHPVRGARQVDECGDAGVEELRELRLGVVGRLFAGIFAGVERRAWDGVRVRDGALVGRRAGVRVCHLSRVVEY